ncbi:hypothetical protein SAMN04515647_4416 [Cohaesibacter sp. ES.047]|uniref:hypothetical protein n=1 Tax=Cohaesibacter sp. ES.047 TaxID=1798205 RepID=UPI000BB81E7D|nr:hypothetical protein [Cohaesibacter sp. ES.047]SNY94093.1 hypothetical protein SAMN04515647_4416 [Cohaesibacter sp. ES.047]
MKRHHNFSTSFKPPISVSPLRDPASGQVHFRVCGPFQIPDPRFSTVSPSELIELHEKIGAAVEALQRGEGAE